MLVRWINDAAECENLLFSLKTSRAMETNPANLLPIQTSPAQVQSSNKSMFPLPRHPFRFSSQNVRTVVGASGPLQTHYRPTTDPRPRSFFVTNDITEPIHISRVLNDSADVNGAKGGFINAEGRWFSSAFSHGISSLRQATETTSGYSAGPVPQPHSHGQL